MMGPPTSAWVLLLTASLLGTAPLHAKSLSAGRGGRGLDISVGGVRRLRRDLHDSLPYEAQMMSYPTGRGGGNNDLYYQPDEWRGQGLGQALQRLVESDQRQEQQQEEEAAYLAGLFRLLNEAESAGLVSPGDVGVVEEEEADEEEQGPGDFEGPVPPDYDDTGRGLSMGKAAWWGLLEPQLAQTLMDRMEPQLAQVLLNRLRLEKLQQAGLAQRPGAGLFGRSGVALAARSGSGLSRATDQDTLRYLVAKILSSISPAVTPSSSRRSRRELSVTPGGGGARAPSPTHKRIRRYLDDVPPSPSSDPPLLRVKRLEEEEEGWREGGREGGEERYRNTLPSQRQAIGVQRMKRIDTMATDELNHGNHRRRRRAAVNYDPTLLAHYLLQYIDQ